MKLAELSVKNFGKLKEFQCNFKSGLNVIKGGNETGKSTLVKAITQILYGDPHTSIPGQEMVSSKSWGSVGPIVLKASIESGDFSGTIERNFGSGQAKLANESLHIAIDDNHRIAEILTGAIGLSSVELFEATSCIRQGEIAHIDGSVKAIKDKLESLVTGGKDDRAASQIVARIDKRIDDISRKDDNNPGLLQKLEKIQSDFNYNIEKINRDINNVKSWRASLTQVEIAYTNSADDYQNKRQKLEEFAKSIAAMEEIQRLETECKGLTSNFEKIKESGKKLSEINRQLKQIPAIPKKEKDKIDDMESNLKYLRPKYRELENDVETEQQAFDSYTVGSAPIGIAAIAASATVFAAVDFFMKFTQYSYAIGICGLALLSISLFILSKKNTKKSLLKEQLAGKTQKLETVKNEIDEMSVKLNRYFEQYHISSADEARQAVWKRSDLESELKTEKYNYSQYLGGLSEEEFGIKLQNIEKRIADYKIVLEDYGEPDEAEIERLKLIVGQLKEQKENLEIELKSLNRQVETAEGGSELLATYIERKEEAGVKMTELIEELAILNLTKETIEKARQDVMVSTLELLEKRTSEILEMITNGRYKKVRFDESSLKFKVYSPDKKDWVEPNQELSQATIDQVYLTARFALTELLSDKARPPIILDDTFEHFDPSRHAGAMKLLKQMAEDRQILLLTSDDAYDKWADNTIQL